MIKKSVLLGLLVLMGTGSSYYYSYTPLLMDRAELESSLIMVNGAMPIINPGKLCLYGSWVLWWNDTVVSTSLTTVIRPLRNARPFYGCQAVRM
jgi:hypothetical protein